MARGGYRKPGGGVRTPGVGKNSQRTDANQPIKVPNVQDSTDLQVGDRQKLEAGQRIQPIGRGPSPTLPAAPPRGSSTPAGGGAVPSPLPDHLMQMPSTRPGEDEMTPASEAPIEPEDDMEVVLQFLVDNFQDASADRMLQEHRQAKVAPEPQLPAVPDVTETPLEEVPSAEPEPEALEMVDATEPADASLAEEPVAEPTQEPSALE